MRTFTIACLALAACGGASNTTPTTPVAHHDDVAVTTSPVASSPPLFTGAFEVESMTDGKDTLVIADMMKKGHAYDGRMTWEIGADKFKVGMWSVGTPAKLSDSDADPTTTFAEFCRASGEVTGHWEGSALVLGSGVVAAGTGSIIRVHQVKEGARTSRNQTTQTDNCGASFTSTRIDFEIVDKDDNGPTKVRAKAPGVTLTLVRGRAIASVDPSKLFKSD
jgi:hypothetical protein